MKVLKRKCNLNEIRKEKSKHHPTTFSSVLNIKRYSFLKKIKKTTQKCLIIKKKYIYYTPPPQKTSPFLFFKSFIVLKNSFF